MDNNFKLKPKLFTPYMVKNPNFLKGIYGNKIRYGPILIIGIINNQYAFLTAKSYYEYWKKIGNYEILVKKAKNLNPGQLFKNKSLVDTSKICFVNKTNFLSNIRKVESNEICPENKSMILNKFKKIFADKIPEISFMELTCTGKDRWDQNIYDEKILHTTKYLLCEKEWKQINGDNQSNIPKKDLKSIRNEIKAAIPYLQRKNKEFVLGFYQKKIEPLLIKNKI